MEDMISHMKEVTGAPKHECKRAINLCMALFEDALKNDITLKIAGCMEIGVRKRASWTAPDFKTGNPVTYPETRMPYAKFGSRFTRAAKGGDSDGI